MQYTRPTTHENRQQINKQQIKKPLQHIKLTQRKKTITHNMW